MKRLLMVGLAFALVFSAPTAAVAQSGSDLFQQGLQRERVDGDLKAAIAIYERVVKQYASNRALAAKALVQLGGAYEKLGSADAKTAYQRVLREYAEQSEAAGTAQARLAALSANGTLAIRTDPTVRRVWADPDADITGAPTRDGKSLTYIDWVTGDLAVRDLGTGEKRHLTDKGPWTKSYAFALNSVASPDGKRIVYTWYNDPQQGGGVELRVVGIDGGGARPVYANAEMDYVQPSDWSADGRWILALLSGKDRVNRIATINVADGSVRVLKTLDWRYPTRMSFSPDGKFLVYDFPPDENTQHRDVYVLAADGSSEAALVAHSADDVALGWTPDGRYVLFATDRTGSMSVWLAPVHDGKPAGEPQLVRRDAESVMEPMGFTRDGAFYYGTNASPIDMFVASIDSVTGKLDGSAARIVDHGVGSNSGADWSHDGKFMSYVSKGRGSANGNTRLIIRSLQTGVERLVPAQLASFGRPRWSPDDRYIIAGGKDQKGRLGIFRIDPQTGLTVSLVVVSDHYVSFAGWSEDGESIIYRQQDFGHLDDRIVIQKLNGSETHDLFRVTGKRVNISNARVSEDGRQVAFVFHGDSADGPGIRVISATGGDVTDLVRAPQGFEIGSLTWSADGRYVFYALTPPPRDSAAPQGPINSQLMRVAATGGAPLATGVVMDNIDFLRPLPDGRRISFTAGASSYHVWVMENFLPKLEKRSDSRAR